MNFYGDSFHVTRPRYNFGWNYGPANSNQMVVNTARINSELGKTYQPQQVNLGTISDRFAVSTRSPHHLPIRRGPANCNDINNAAITAATDGGTVGFMLLNGKRLGNLSAIEAIPNAAILGFRQNQVTALGAAIAGEIFGMWDRVAALTATFVRCARPRA